MEFSEISKSQLGWLWLSQFDFVTISKRANLYNELHTGEEVLDIEKNILVYKDNFEQKEIDILRNSQKEFKEVKNALKLLDKLNIKFITIEDDEFLDRFKIMYTPCTILFYVGDVSLLNMPMISFVGTRHITNYGKEVIDEFAKGLVNSGVVICSGLTDGVDRKTHLDVNKYGGKSVGVAIGGLNNVYPSTANDLVRMIAKEGLVISEVMPNVKSSTQLIGYQNRLIGSIAKSIFLVEAGENSGAKFALEYALEMGANIYTVPCTITNKDGQLNNIYIKNCSSSLVTSYQEVLQDLGYDVIDVDKEVEKIIKKFDKDEDVIISLLSNQDTLHFDAISNLTKFDTKKLLSLLTKMELCGIIDKLAGNQYKLHK